MKPKTPFIFLLLLFHYSSNGFSQASGKVDYPTLGLSFIIPDGWVGQETETGYMIGSNSVPGFIMIMESEATSIEELESGAREGIMDQSGTNLKLTGDLENISNRSRAGLFSGTIENQKARAYIIGLLNSFGSGLTILAASTEAEFGEVHISAAKALAQSVSFRKPELPEASKIWSDRLQNAKLTYMDSYYSGGGSYGGYSTGGGYSTKEVIGLCEDGSFYFLSSSDISVDEGGAFASSHDSGDGRGSWKVISNANEEAVLQLNYSSGRVSEYVISEKEDKTYLNGYRYFRTYGQDGPDCR